MTGYLPYLSQVHNTKNYFSGGKTYQVQLTSISENALIYTEIGLKQN